MARLGPRDDVPEGYWTTRQEIANAPKNADVRGRFTFHSTDILKDKVPDASFDAIFVHAAIHHFFEIDAMFALMHRVLKPGGVFIAMDHAANAGAPNSIAQTTHRVDPATVLAAAKAAGLTYIDKNDVLANPSDDRTKPVFDATIRRHTDQFLFRFKKPG